MLGPHWGVLSAAGMSSLEQVDSDAAMAAALQAEEQEQAARAIAHATKASSLQQDFAMRREMMRADGFEEGWAGKEGGYNLEHRDFWDVPGDAFEDALSDTERGKES